MGTKRKENQSDHISRKHVGEKTDGQRKNARQVADQFDRQHQQRQGEADENRHRRIRRSQEVLQVGNPSVLESLRLVVHEGAKGAAQGNDGHGGRRLEAGDHANQVAEQNEEAERSQERCIAFAVMADDLVALALDESFDALESVLQRARDGPPKAANEPA